MLIVYRKNDGHGAYISGTNSAYPDGPPFEAQVGNAIAVHGGEPEDYEAYRLHDSRDRDTVQAVLAAGSCAVLDGTLTLYDRVSMVASPEPATAGQDVTCTATVPAGVTGDATFSVAGIDGSEQVVAFVNGGASAIYAFADAGVYSVQVDSGPRHGVTWIEIEVT